MQELDDNTLLREYADHDSEEAFAALVARHVNKVYSVALRHTGNPHQAEEITQTVFVILARKSSHLGKHVILEGWLYQTARLTALTSIRREIRRTQREQEAHMQNTVDENQSEVWTQIVPLLDMAIARLNETDRHAVVLRFFYGKTMKEVGAALGGSEGAATLRLHRALEKLRKIFLKHGVSTTTAIIAVAISANSAQAAPATLAQSITAVAVAKGATASGLTSILTLVKSSPKLLAWANAKTAVITLLIVGTSAFVVQSQFKAGSSFPASTWADAGYDDPASAFKTLMWAISRNDTKAILASVSPTCQAEFKQLATQSDPPITVERFILQEWADKMRRVLEFRILESASLGDDQVLFNLSAKMEGKPDNHWIKLKKIEGQWKFDDFDFKSNVNGRTGWPLPTRVYGGVGIKMQLDEQTHDIRISEIVSNSPASKAGLSTGWVVKTINGVSTTKKSVAECVFLTRGLLNRPVWLTLVDSVRNQTNAMVLERKASVY